MSLRRAFSVYFTAFVWSFALPSSAAAEADELPVGTKVVRVQVVDSSGSPVAGAEISRIVWTEQKDFERNEKVLTSADGIAEVTMPETMRIFRLWINKDGYPRLSANWSAPATDNVPHELQVVLPRAKTIGGLVVDPDGKPITDARIEVRIAGSWK